MLPCLSVGASLLYNLQVELTSRLLVIMSAESRNAEAACLARHAIWCRLSHLLLPSLGGLKSRFDHVPWWGDRNVRGCAGGGQCFDLGCVCYIKPLKHGVAHTCIPKMSSVRTWDHWTPSAVLSHFLQRPCLILDVFCDGSILLCQLQHRGTCCLVLGQESLV